MAGLAASPAELFAGFAAEPGTAAARAAAVLSAHRTGSAELAGRESDGGADGVLCQSVYQAAGSGGTDGRLGTGGLPVSAFSGDSGAGLAGAAGALGKQPGPACICPAGAGEAGTDCGVSGVPLSAQSRQ